MIDFKGYLSGKAEKYFFKTQTTLEIKAGITTSIVILVIGEIITAITHEAIVLQLSLLAALLMTVVFCMPRGKKIKRKCVINRIFTDEEYIVSECETSTRHMLIKDALALHDYGEFYQVIFWGGGRSVRFICQKDLLVQGTLEEFESLFKGKVVRKY